MSYSARAADREAWIRHYDTETGELMTGSNGTRYTEQHKHTQRVLKAWAATPELRLGQFISNAITHQSGVCEGADVFYCKDEDLVVACEAFVKSLKVGV